MDLSVITDKSPSQWAKEDPDGHYDCTLYIGQAFLTEKDLTPAWPMFSYNRPASILWSAIAQALYRRGWNDKEIKTWLQSKNPRWALDGSLGDMLEQLGTMYAAQCEKV